MRLRGHDVASGLILCAPCSSGTLAPTPGGGTFLPLNRGENSGSERLGHLPWAAQPGSAGAGVSSASLCHFGEPSPPACPWAGVPSR